MFDKKCHKNIENTLWESILLVQLVAVLYVQLVAVSVPRMKSSPPLS